MGFAWLGSMGGGCTRGVDNVGGDGPRRSVFGKCAALRIRRTETKPLHGLGALGSCRGWCLGLQHIVDGMCMGPCMPQGEEGAICRTLKMGLGAMHERGCSARAGGMDGSARAAGRGHGDSSTGCMADGCRGHAASGAATGTAMPGGRGAGAAGGGRHGRPPGCGVAGGPPGGRRGARASRCPHRGAAKLFRDFPLRLGRACRIVSPRRRTWLSW